MAGTAGPVDLGSVLSGFDLPGLDDDARRALLTPVVVARRPEGVHLLSCTQVDLEGAPAVRLSPAQLSAVRTRCCLPAVRADHAACAAIALSRASWAASRVSPSRRVVALGQHSRLMVGRFAALAPVLDELLHRAQDLTQAWVGSDPLIPFRAAALMERPTPQVRGTKGWGPDEDTHGDPQLEARARELRTLPGGVLVASRGGTRGRGVLTELCGAEELLADVLEPHLRSRSALVLPAGLDAVVDLKLAAAPTGVLTRVALTPDQHGDETLLETACVLVSDGFDAPTALVMAGALL